VSASHHGDNWTNAKNGGGTSPSSAPRSPFTDELFQLGAAVAVPAAPQPIPLTHHTGFKVLLGGALTLMFAGFTACIAGFFIAVKELMRTCREATAASNNVAESCENFSRACEALKVTLVQADSVINNVEALSGGAGRRTTSGDGRKLGENNQLAARLFQQNRSRPMGAGLNPGKNGGGTRYEYGETMTREAMYASVMELIDRNTAVSARER
jgi:tRNA (guanine10-N2)-methyltransferase